MDLISIAQKILTTNLGDAPAAVNPLSLTLRTLPSRVWGTQVQVATS